MVSVWEVNKKRVKCFSLIHRPRCAYYVKQNCNVYFRILNAVGGKLTFSVLDNREISVCDIRTYYIQSWLLGRV
jgi:hypothetical protein